MSRFIVPFVCLALAGTAAASCPALAATHQANTSPKISMSKARQIAKNVSSGQIMKEELEHEAGGSGLRYSFDMRAGKTWREVGVDAVTGKILENKAEGANPRD